MRMTATVFVDTNVLLYAFDKADPKKQAAASHWRTELWSSKRGRLSVQVLQEFYANILRKWPLAKDEARAEIRNLTAWHPVPMDYEILLRGWQLQDRFQLSFWDSLIVAAAKAGACNFLLTEDLQAGQDFEGVLVISPFASEPASVLS
jgi:predicted nucleic acid-binding protein